MKIGIGCDHGGFELKQEILNHLAKQGIAYVDYGTYSLDSVDYPDYSKKVVDSLLDGAINYGILICGTGIGISIAANRYEGIRAALCTNEFMAQATREHNDANILALGGRVIGVGTALRIVDTFLNTPFSEDQRHVQRISKIESKA